MTHIRTLLDQMAQIDEGRMKDIFTADQEGKSAKEIARRLKLPLGTVKKILGEDEELKEFTNTQLDSLAKSYASMQGKTISIPNANKLRKIFDRIPDGRLNDLRKKKIPFLSGLALSRMIQKGIPVREELELEEDSNKTYQVKDETGKVVFTGKYNQVLSYRKKNGGEIVTEIIRIRPKNAIGEKKSPFRLSYSKQGTHAGFEDADTLSDLQNKAQKLRSKGFTIDKMGRNTSPVKESKQKPYVSSSGGQYSVLDGDGKEVYKTSNKQLAHAWFKKNYDNIKEAKGVTLDKTGKAAILYQVTANVPKQMSTDGKTVMVRPGIKKYDVEGRNKQDAIKRFARYFKMRSTSGIKAVPDPRSEIEKYYYVPRSRIDMWQYGGEDKKGNTLYIKSDYEPMGETILEYTTKQIKQAYGILNDPRYKQGNYTGAYKAIEKIAKGLAKHKDVANALRRANEEYVHPGKATFERIWREVSDKLKLKVLDRKIKRTKEKFYKNLRRP